MAKSPAETYTEKLLNRLYTLYGDYIAELQIIEKGLENSSIEVLETFSGIEQHRFQQISSIEKVLATHLQGCAEAFRKSSVGKLNVLRLKALNTSREVRLKLGTRMKQIRTELSSIRLPGRAKNYKQESVPVLIDIER